MARTLPLPLYEVSRSMVKTFQRCRQRYVFRYLFRLSRRKANYNLIIGSAVHRGFEILLKQDGRPIAERIPAAHKAVNSYVDEYQATVDPSLNIDTDKLEYARSQSLAVVEAWAISHGDQQWTVLGLEVIIRAKPQPTTKADKAEFQMEDRYCGMLDGLIIDDADILLWILEHKTRASLANRDFVGSLELDLQALWYFLLAIRWLQTNKEKHKQLKKIDKPSGMMFDAMQKPLHRNAATFDALYKRMAQAMVEDPDKYFFLQPIFLSEDVVKRAISNFRRVVKQMDELTRDSVTQNLDDCFTYGEGGCPYQPLCKSGVKDLCDLDSLKQTDEFALFEDRSPYEELEADGEE